MKVNCFDMAVGNLMKSLIVPYLLSLVSVAIVFGLAPSVCEARVAFQEKSAEADELEKMILERIKQRKAEMAKERGGKGLAGNRREKDFGAAQSWHDPSQSCPSERKYECDDRGQERCDALERPANRSQGIENGRAVDHDRFNQSRSIQTSGFNLVSPKKNGQM